MKSVKFFIILLFLNLTVFHQASAIQSHALWGNLEQGPYQVGFKLIEKWDHSRAYYPKCDYEHKQDKGERARPIRVYVWYPAEESDISPMLFTKYFHLALNDFGTRQETDEKIMRYPDRDLFDTAKMNLLGYKFLYFWGNIDHAIKIFKPNVENHSRSFNIYDSLGEAYMVNGQAENAIRNY